jgi:uncharacterized protein DUF5667
MIEKILDLCLEEIRARRATVTDCLQKYPQYASELEPLLKTAFTLESLRDVKPSPAFKSQTRARLLRLSRPVPVPRRQILARFSFATVTLIVLIAIGLTGGIVYAANDSLPDSPLYPIKRGTERVEILLARDAESQARAYMTFAERRLDEAEALVNKPEQSTLVEQTIAEYNNQVGASLAVVPVGLSGGAPLTQELTNRITRQEEALKTMDRKVSASSLEKALSGAQKAKEKLNASASPSPFVVPPTLISPEPTQPTKTSTSPSATVSPLTPHSSTLAAATPSIPSATLTVSVATVAPKELTEEPVTRVTPIPFPPILLPPSLPTIRVP